MSDNDLSIGLDSSGVVSGVDKAVKSLEKLATSVKGVESSLGTTHKNISSKLDVAALYDKAAKAAGASADAQAASFKRLFKSLEDSDKSLQGSVQEAYHKRLTSVGRMHASELLLWKQHGAALATEQEKILGGLSEKGIRKALRGTTAEGRAAISNVLSAVQSEMQQRVGTIGTSLFSAFRSNAEQSLTKELASLTSKVSLTGLAGQPVAAVKAFEDSVAKIKTLRASLWQAGGSEEFDKISMESLKAAKRAALAYTEIVGKLTTSDKEFFNSLGLSAGMLARLEAGSVGTAKSLKILGEELRLTALQAQTVATKDARYDMLRRGAASGDVSSAKTLARTLVKAEADLSAATPGDSQHLAILSARYGKQALEAAAVDARKTAADVVANAEILKEAAVRAKKIKQDAASIIAGTGSLTIAGKDVKFAQTLSASVSSAALSGVIAKVEQVKAQLSKAGTDTALLQRLELQHGKALLDYAKTADLTALNAEVASRKVKEASTASEKLLTNAAKLDAKLGNLYRNALQGDANAARSYANRVKELKSTLIELEKSGSTQAVSGFKGALSPKTLGIVETTTFAQLDNFVTDAKAKAKSLQDSVALVKASTNEATKTLDTEFKRLKAMAKGQRDPESLKAYRDQLVSITTALQNGAQPAALVPSYGSAAVAEAMRTSQTELNKLAIAHERAKDGAHQHGAAVHSLNKAMQQGHNIAKGLSAAYGALWMTWGPLAPMLAGSALGYGTKAVVSFGSALDQTLTSVVALGETSKADIESINSALLAMGSSSIHGPNELAKALKTLTLAGLDAKQSLVALPDVMNLAVAGEVDVGKAAESLVAISTAFGVNSAAFGSVSDIIAKTAAVSMSSVSGMAESFRSSTVIAEQYGVSLDEVALGLAAVSNVGVKGSAAGTAMRNFMTDLSGRTDKLKEQIKQLGIEAFNSKGDFIGMVAWAEKLSKATSQLTPVGKKDLIEKLTTERGGKIAERVISLYSDTSITQAERDYIDRVNAMLEATTDATQKAADETVQTETRKYNKLTLLQAKIADSYGFTAVAAAQMNATLQGQWQMVSAAFETSALQAFEGQSNQVLTATLNLRETLASPDFVSALANISSGLISVASTAIKFSEALAVGAAGLVTYKLAAAPAVAALAGFAPQAGAAATGILATAGAIASAHPIAAAFTATLLALGGAYMYLRGEAEQFSNMKLDLSKGKVELENLTKTAEEQAKQIQVLRRQASDGVDSDTAKATTHLEDLTDQLTKTTKSLNLAREAIGRGEKTIFGAPIADYKANLEQASQSLKDRIAKVETVVRQAKTIADLNKQLQTSQVKPAAGTQPFAPLAKASAGKSPETLDNQELANLKRSHSAQMSEIADFASKEYELLTAQKNAKVLSAELYEAAVVEGQASSYSKQLDLLTAYEQQVSKVVARGNVTGQAAQAARDELAAERAKVLAKESHRNALAGLAQQQKVNERNDQVALELTNLRTDSTKRLDDQLKSVSETLLGDRDKAIYTAKIAETHAYTEALNRLNLALEKNSKDSDSAMMSGLSAEAVNQTLDSLDKSRAAILANIAAVRSAKESAESAAASMAASVYDYTHSWEYGATQAVKDYERQLFDTAARSKAAISGLINSVDKLFDKMAAGGTLNLGDLKGSASDLGAFIQNDVASSLKGGVFAGLKSAYSGGSFTDAFTGAYATLSGASTSAQALTALQYGTQAGSQQTAMLAAQEAGMSFDFQGAFTYAKAAYDVLRGDSLGKGIGAALGQYFGGPLAPLASLIGAQIGSAVDKAFSGETRAGGQYAYQKATGAALLLSGPSGGQIAGDQVTAAISSTVTSINDLLKKAGATASISAFKAGLESSGNGRGGVYSGGTLSTGQSFGESGVGSNYAGTLYEKTSNQSVSASEALANFNEDLAQVTIQALQAANIGGVLGQKLAELGDAEKLTAAQATSVVSQIQQFSELSSTLAELPIKNLQTLTLDAVYGLSQAAGGISALSSGISAYFSVAYTEDEKRLTLAKQVAATLNSAGWAGTYQDVLNASREQLRAFTESIDVTTASGQKLTAALYSIAPAFESIVSYTESVNRATIDARFAKISASEFDYYSAETQASKFSELFNGIINLATNASSVVRGIELSKLNSANTQLFNVFNAANDAVSAVSAAFEKVSRSADAARVSIESAYDLNTKAINTKLETFNASVSSASGLLGRAYEDEKTKLDTAYNASVKRAEASAKAISAAMAALSDALGSAKTEVDASSYEAARLNIMRADNTVASVKNLESSFAIVAGFDAKTLYATKVEYAVAQAALRAKLQQLDATGKTVADTETIKATLQDSYDTQLKALDAQKASAEKQLSALNGVDTSVVSMTAATKVVSDLQQKYLPDQANVYKQQLETLQVQKELQLAAINQQTQYAQQYLDSFNNVDTSISDVAAAVQSLSSAIVTAVSAKATAVSTLDSVAQSSGITAQATGASVSTPAAPVLPNYTTTVAPSGITVVRSGGRTYGVNMLNPAQAALNIQGLIQRGNSDAGLLQFAKDNNLPGFATGGNYAGGLALVGEQGPELINFNNPGRVYTAQETSEMLSSVNSVEVVGLLKQVISDGRVNAQGLANVMLRVARLLEKWEGSGIPETRTI